MSDQDQGYGQITPVGSNSDLNAIASIVSQMTARMETAKLVQVVKVTGGGVAPAGTVDVLPLVQQIDGNGNGTPHGVVPGLPWSRVQGGTSAVICDPVVGDVGYVVAMDRDTSVVRAQSPGSIPNDTKGFLPGTRRRFDIADGVYAGGCLNVAPNQYLIFTSTGVRLVDLNGNSVAMGPSGITLSDLQGNSVTTGTTGMTLADLNGNEVIMASGFVNVVTASFQVNGVPVTVP
jgi:hypothetical protein